MEMIISNYFIKTSFLLNVVFFFLLHTIFRVEKPRFYQKTKMTKAIEWLPREQNAASIDHAIKHE